MHSKTKQFEECGSMKIHISKTNYASDSVMILFIVLYRLLLDLIYTKHLYPLFGYMGFEYNLDFGLISLSWLLLIITFPFVIKCSTRGDLSDVITLLLIYLSYIPFTTMVAYYGYSLGYIFANTLYWIILLLSSYYLPSPKKHFDLKIANKQYVLSIIEILFSFTILYISWRYTGFRFSIDLSQVYAYRMEARLSSMPTVLNYLFAASKAVIPILLVYYLDVKKYWHAGLLLLIQIFSFSINGSKTVLFGTLLSIILFIIYNNRYLKTIPQLLLGVSVVAFIETSLFKSYFVLSYFLRRVLFLPNMLGEYYFDFFSTNEPDYYRQSFLRLFGVKSPYSEIDNLIGTLYFNKPDMAANNGLSSDAITNLGYIGLIVMPYVLMMVLKYLDKCTYGIDKRIYISTAITYSVIIISSFLPTILLSHGLFVLSLVLLLLPRFNNQNSEANNDIQKNNKKSIASKGQ